MKYYFGAHRSNKNRMISHLKIQSALGVAVGGLVIFFHFSTRVWPGFSSHMSNFEPQRTIPYLVVLGSLVFCYRFAIDRQSSYETFIKNSPGIIVDTTAVVFVPGHTVD